jgi:GntR family transcriptional regulator
MNIEINFRDHVPIYVQLMEQIKHQIATGKLKPGDQLPTVRQLAADLRVNFNTVARAYRLLDEDAIISTQHGRGTFILDPLSDKEATELRRKDFQRLTSQYLTSADRLGFSPKEVQATFKQNLNIWIENGAPPAPDYDE